MKLGELIDARADLKTERAIAQRVVDGLDDQIKELEKRIMAAMQEAGLDIAAGTKAKVTIKEDVQPNVTNWDEFHTYIRDNNAFYLLQKRVTATAFREAVTAGLEIPGIRGVPVKSLSITSI